MTACVLTTASGNTLDSFFIFSGVNEIERWYESLECELFKDDMGPHWLKFEDWFPKDAVVVESENGSMTKELIPQIIDHISKYASRNLETGKKVLFIWTDIDPEMEWSG